MGYSIPVIFFSVDKSELPAELESWLDVISLLGEHDTRRDELGWHESVSRNWWHQDALDKICRGLGIEGLNFITIEVSCLDAVELETAATALDTVIDSVRSGIPELGDVEPDPGTIWWLRHNTCSDGRHELVSPETFARAFEVAQESDAVNYGGGGYAGLVSFYAFVKLLRQVIRSTMADGKYLLYVQPQP
jgi:hypothetical protein